MKLHIIKSPVMGMLLLASALSGFSQGFVNLDFESAKIIPAVDSPYYPYGIEITNALPGWAVWGITQGRITYNAPAVGSTWVSLWATNGSQISGNYSVFLQGGGTAPAATISQTGLVPASAVSLLFEAQAGNGSLTVTLGGQNISFAALSTGPNYTLYGGDISAFAGQVTQLSFSALNIPGIYPNEWNLDNIKFSSTPVPEPSVLGLFALGGLLLGFRRRKK